MYGNISQQKLAPYRGQKTKWICFHTIQAPTEKYFRILPKFVVHKLSLPNQNPNCTEKR